MQKFRCLPVSRAKNLSINSFKFHAGTQIKKLHVFHFFS